MTLPGYFKVSIRLDLITPLDPNEQGYPRSNTDTVVDLSLVGKTEQQVLGQAKQHVEVLLNAHTPVKGLDR